MTVFNIIRNALLAGLGLQETVKIFLDDLVKKGELSESQSAKLFNEWTKKAGKASDKLNKNLSERVTKTFNKMNLPTKDDIGKINKEIQILSQRLENIERVIEDVQKK